MPKTPVSGGIRLIRIFAEVPWEVGKGASNDSGVVETAIFSDFASNFSETLEMRPLLLYSDTQSVVSFSAIPNA